MPEHLLSTNFFCVTKSPPSQQESLLIASQVVGQAQSNTAIHETEKVLDFVEGMLR